MRLRRRAGGGGARGREAVSGQTPVIGIPVVGFRRDGRPSQLTCYNHRPYHLLPAQELPLP